MSEFRCADESAVDQNLPPLFQKSLYTPFRLSWEPLQAVWLQHSELWGRGVSVVGIPKR